MLQTGPFFPFSGIVAIAPSQLDLSSDGTTYAGTLTWSYAGPKGTCGGTTQFTASIFVPGVTP